MKTTQNRRILGEHDLIELHKIELELLIEMDRICRKHNILYSIDGGTLLGAIRHKGFIPWDDDADVIMNREAYQKFISVVDKELDSSKFYFQDMNRTKGYRWGYGKLRRQNTEFIRLNQEHMPYKQGIFLDVFVCDNVPDNYLLRCVCNFHSFIYRKILYSEIGKNVAKGFSKIIYQILNQISEQRLKKSYNAYVKYRNRKHTNTVKCLTFPACNKTYGYKRNWYEETIDIEFENVILKGCKDYDEYLTFLYGDYMKLPPIEKRKVHPVSKLTLLS
ncbi:MAG: LicD family protein [Lachnospiraceae bacterium]|nr:LicD family protein [Lachnospiraceae bacterium]MCI9141211.1 LicD family protein [Lachnospiraceae bacterium]